MTTINSYVSKGFFDEFIQSKPQRILSDDYKLWLNLYRFFDKRLTNLRLGVSRENLAELYNKNDELIRSLVDDYYEGKPNIILENWDEDKEQMKEEINKHPFQFFFTSSQENIDDTIIKGGFPVYNSSNGLMSSSKFLNFEILPISKNEATNTLKNWRELIEKLLPFYTLTIVDNYLFKSRRQIENNTIPLIRSIAHRAKAKTSFHLTLVYCEEKKEKINGKFISVLDTNGKKIYQNNIDDIYTEIESELIDVFKDSNRFKLSIVRLNESKDFHDRVIFTNSQFNITGHSI